ncbi:MAG: hypothetical protein IMX01_04420 [Limnochordaceae bacterium]|nr:hypothetical protein [Limnochordaceae bacterium]
MKKFAVVVSASLMLAAAAPVVAAGPSMTGSLEGKISWNQGKDPSIAENLGLTLGFQAGDKTKAVLGLGPSFDGTHNAWTASIGSIDVTKAYVETQGPWWNGGPEVTTRLGDLDISYSPYVATIASTGGQTAGIGISGLQVGPFAVAGFHAWDKKAGPADSRLQNEQVSGGQISGTIAGVKLAATGVQAGENQSAVAVEGSTQVLPNVGVSGVIARDMLHKANLYRLDATMQPVNNVTVTAEYGRVPSAFRPLYAYEDTDAATDGTTTDDSWVTNNRGQSVINLGAQTQVSGFDLGAGVKLARPEAAEQFSRTQTTLTAGRHLTVAGQPVDASYTLTIDAANQLRHDITAKSTINLIPQLQNVNVDGTVTMANSHMTWKANAGYTAPNGMTFGLHYDTNPDATTGVVPGASADMGLKVSF